MPTLELEEGLEVKIFFSHTIQLTSEPSQLVVIKAVGARKSKNLNHFVVKAVSTERNEILNRSNKDFIRQKKLLLCSQNLTLHELNN